MTHHRIESLEAFAGRLTGAVLILLTLIGVTIAASGPQDTPSSDSIAARLDPYVEKDRWFFSSETSAIVTPRVAGTALIILAVEHNGSPALTSCRRIILTIRPR